MAGAKKSGEKKDETGTGTKPCELGSEFAGYDEFKEQDSCDKAKEEDNKYAKDKTQTQEKEGEKH